MVINTAETAIVENNEAIVDTKFRIYYSTDKFVPVPIVIEALKAIENMLQHSNKFVEAAYPNIKVYDSEVFIEHLESGSLGIELVVRWVLGDKNYERGAKLANDAKQYLVEVVQDSPTMKNIAIAATSAIIAAGATYAYTKNSTPPAPAPVTIINNGIMNQSGTVIITPEKAQEILEKVPKKQAAKDAISFVKPAKLDPKSEIEIGDIKDSTDHVQSVTIESSFIAKIPEKYEPPIPEEREQKYTNTPIAIFASDKDKQSTGWAGIIPNIIDKRINFEIDESINPSQLHGRLNTNADLIVHERFNANKKRYEPYKVVITAIA
ncbi:hypothetical protein J507_3166 [Acinetobacter sp. 1295259]|uniref:hypothetical protein n=1 Tax=Acinetobacter calcoaceticus/baumannii complex TaxID=909768 RepID=UPI000452F6D5|nr:MULTISPECIES: hypothetical protein [Acinetobacter calcoaceticus/baumannii complex]EXA96565.1 hypothetical protein J507_3166 [Acinetobacter sp. 1295259]MDC4449264.1 hypothetical protein [Acinetobacter baumannii]MDC5303117.1 hypothetical protein [Acinetobacter baumannii]RSO69550.1 hypothetical protein EA754_20025 [Acinetobacter pittii]